jgi:hypothetical protein
MSKYEELLRRHYESVWKASGVPTRLSEGPLWELSPQYSVLKFSPQHREGAARAWRYATCGMSEPGSSELLELFMESPVQCQRIVELLNMTAHFHRTGERLGLGHSVNFGGPWLPGSKCDYGLVCLPYLDGPVLERTSLQENNVRVLWLLPITKAERDYKKRFGLEALERVFDKVRLNYLDAERPSVV